MRVTQEFKMKSFLIYTVHQKLFGLQWAMRCTSLTEHMGGMRNAYTILVGKPEGKRSLVMSKRRWKWNIEMDLESVACKIVVLIVLAANRVSGRLL
jgi:hypothetical protein